MQLQSAPFRQPWADLSHKSESFGSDCCVDTFAFAPKAGILVVDDFQPFRAQIKALLEKHPEYRVLGEAVDGVEAVDLAGDLRPDIILLDIGLPRMHGMEAARLIAECSPASKVIFVTQESCGAVAEVALQHHGWGYVVKMDVGRELLNAIETVLRGQRYIPSRFADCAWARELSTDPPDKSPIEVPLLVRANAALASTRAAASSLEHAKRRQEHLIRDNRRGQEDTRREHEDVNRRYSELLERF